MNDTPKQPTEAEQRCALAEMIGWTHYAVGHNATPEQKSAGKWWDNQDPAELIDLPTLAVLTNLARWTGSTGRWHATEPALDWHLHHAEDPAEWNHPTPRVLAAEVRRLRAALADIASGSYEDALGHASMPREDMQSIARAALANTQDVPGPNGLRPLGPGKHTARPKASRTCAGPWINLRTC